METQEIKQIKVGSVVRLTSGSVDMTVVSGDAATQMIDVCYYHENIGGIIYSRGLSVRCFNALYSDE